MMAMLPATAGFFIRPPVLLSGVELEAALVLMTCDWAPDEPVKA